MDSDIIRIDPNKKILIVDNGSESLIRGAFDGISRNAPCVNVLSVPGTIEKCIPTVVLLLFS